ncbi:MAG: VOC family protein [bacterium]|nr:VOC family protein [bacterium]
MSRFQQVHPVLAVRDVRKTARWFCDHLGFRPLFADNDAEPRYAGIGRDDVEIHLQWHGEEEWAAGLCGAAYRFLVDDPDALFEEAFQTGAVPPGKQVDDTDWGTREFGLYDPNGNAVFFYRDRG